MQVIRLSLFAFALLTLSLAAQAQTAAHRPQPHKAVPNQIPGKPVPVPEKISSPPAIDDSNHIILARRSHGFGDNGFGDNGFGANRLPSSVLVQPQLPTHGMRSLISSPPFSITVPTNEPKRFYAAQDAGMA